MIKGMMGAVLALSLGVAGCQGGEEGGGGGGDEEMNQMSPAPTPDGTSGMEGGGGGPETDADEERDRMSPMPGGGTHGTTGYPGGTTGSGTSP